MRAQRWNGASSVHQRWNLVLLGVFLVLVGAHWAMPSDPTVRNFHFMPDMVDSVAYEAQAPPPQLAAGLTLDLRPPEGSVARGYLPLLYEATPEGAARAGAELRNPNLTIAATDPADAAVAAAVAVDVAAAVERGRFVFATFCATCHGGEGAGDGPVTRRGVPPPPSLLLPHARELADGQLYHVVTFGQGNMAGYAAQVGRDDRWNVVSFVRALQEETAVQETARQGEAVQGERPVQEMEP